MNTSALRTLRFAATLADVAPSVRLQLRRGKGGVLRVARDERGERDVSDTPICHPDAFRMSVAHAYRNHILRRPAGVFEAIAGGAPAIDVRLRPGDIAFPGGIYRFRTGERNLHLFMTTLAPNSCQQAFACSLGGVAEGPCDELACGSWQRVGLHFDELTEVTVVHAFAAECGASHARDAMVRMLEVVVAAEALVELGVGVTGGPSEVRP